MSAPIPETVTPRKRSWEYGKSWAKALKDQARTTFDGRPARTKGKSRRRRGKR